MLAQHPTRHASATRQGCRWRSRFDPLRGLACYSCSYNTSSVLLPGAVWILDKEQHNKLPVYGAGFVIKRQGVPSCNTFGLVLRRGVYTDLQVMSREESLQLTLGNVVRQSACLEHSLQICKQPHLAHVGGFLPSPRLAVLQLLPAPTTVQIACDRFQPAGVRLSVDTPPKEMEDELYVSVSSSPRRTSRVKFKCDRCGATNIKPINPHAWHEGTIFAKCGKCSVTHKLIDNLHLFHELSGPIFPGAARGEFDVPNKLQLKNL